MRAYERVNIGAILGKEFDDFVELLPKELQYKFSKEAYIAGGSIHSVYVCKPINDIDFFIESSELKDELVNYFNSLNGLKVKFTGGVAIKVGKYKGMKLVITPNAITIGDYQIVMKDIGKPEDVVGKFDFKHNMFYVKDGKFNNVAEEYYLDLDELRFNDERARDIVSTIMRTAKFQKKGWKITPTEMGKMLLQLHKVGFTDEEIEMLEGKLDSTSFGSGH